MFAAHWNPLHSSDLRQRAFRWSGLALATALGLGVATARAEPQLLTGVFWGEADNWQSGRFPGAGDDVAFFQGRAHLTTATGLPFAATASNVLAFDADLLWVPGSSLNAARLHRPRVDMLGGVLAVRGVGVGNESQLAFTRIRHNGAGEPSIMTVGRGGQLQFVAETLVDGTLDLRGDGGLFVNESGSTMRLRNNGAAPPLPRTGGLRLFFESRFVNQGLLSIEGDAQISSVSDSFAGANRLENAPGGRIEVETAAHPSGAFVRVPLSNQGVVDVGLGTLTLAAGGSHGGTATAPAELLVSQSASRLSMWGEHRVVGQATAGGPGWITLGGAFSAPAGSVVVESTGLLALNGRLEVRPGSGVIVQPGGRVRTEAGAFVAAAGDFTVEAGGSFIHQGAMQLGAVVRNAGVLEVLGRISYGNDSAAFVQQAGGRLFIDASGEIDLTDRSGALPPLPGGSFRQTGGVTRVDGQLFAGDVRFEAGVVSGSGRIGYDTLASSGVVFGPGLTVRPGNSPGRLTIEGNLLAAGALFEIEIAGSEPGLQLDQLAVFGDADLTGASVLFQFIDGYLPSVDDRLSWLDVSGSAMGLDTLTVSFASDAGSVEGFVDSAGTLVILSVTPIPEPGTWALWLAGLGAVGFVARRETALKPARGGGCP